MEQIEALRFHRRHAWWSEPCRAATVSEATGFATIGVRVTEGPIACRLSVVLARVLARAPAARLAGRFGEESLR